MKLLTAEEISEHKAYTLKGGFLGCVAGVAISFAGMRYLPRKFPNFKPHTLPWSLRTAMFITPPTLISAIAAEEASNKFDEMRYSGDYKEKQEKQQELEWAEMSSTEKVVTFLSNHKYKVITGAWAGSLYASWHIINRDPIMTKPQKIVQARMYAQFITVLLLLGTIALSTWEASMTAGSTAEKRQRQEEQRWKHALEAAEREEAKLAEGTINKTGFQSNEERIGAKIFKS